MQVISAYRLVRAMDKERGSILNFNVGILGHVDRLVMVMILIEIHENMLNKLSEKFFSGKTSLAKALSTVASTAAFDKNPQSKERGITLDLGFSSFQTDSPDHIKEAYEKTQYTLVDCPGHGNISQFLYIIFLLEK